MYSRNNEEQIILDYFNGKIGSYLDIGAFDGVEYSNTLAMAELGWSGICIEPSPLVFKKLKDNYSLRKLSNIELIEAAFVPEYYPNTIPFYEVGSGVGLGSLSYEHVRYNYSDEHFKDLKTLIVNTIKSSQLSKVSRLNFISIDVESFNLEVLVSLPFDKLINLELLCIEADLPTYRFVNFMKPIGWSLYRQENPNLFFIKNK